MKRKLIISAFFLTVFIVSPLFSEKAQKTPVQQIQQEELPKDTARDISPFEKRFKNINQSISYLKDNNIDYSDITAIYSEAESLLKDIKNNSDFKDYDMTIKFLSGKISILEEKTADRVSLAKRMNFLYIVMVSMGLGIIVVISLYSIYLYSRRK